MLFTIEMDQKLHRILHHYHIDLDPLHVLFPAHQQVHHHHHRCHLRQKVALPVFRSLFGKVSPVFI